MKLWEFDLKGYTYGRPAPVPDSILQTSDVDAICCKDYICMNCFHIGAEYHPFIARNSYRAFAVCPECGEAHEF